MSGLSSAATCKSSVASLHLKIKKQRIKQHKCILQKVIQNINRIIWPNNLQNNSPHVLNDSFLKNVNSQPLTSIIFYIFQLEIIGYLYARYYTSVVTRPCRGIVDHICNTTETGLNTKKLQRMQEV